MRITHCTLQPYRLRLRQPWRSARGVFQHRCGWWLRLHAEGLSGHGDCAPLREAGTETPEQAEASLRRWMAQAPGCTSAMLLERLCERLPSQTPAAQHAIECALLDLEARAHGQTLRQRLNAASHARLAVNAMLGALGPESPARARAARKQGFMVMKLKVGGTDPMQELEWLHAVARVLPSGSRLRLDANGAWSESVAARMLDALDSLPIESIEEPLDLEGLDQDQRCTALAQLQARTPIALARDESLAELTPPIHPETLGTRRLVLKPGALGGARATLQLAERAQAAGCEVVITSLLESAVGLWAVAQIAAASLSPLAHGLDTAAWLAEDLGVAPQPVDGAMVLDDTPGSGFAPPDLL